MIITIKKKGYQCNKCGHEWAARKLGAPLPRMCPCCKTVRWNDKELLTKKGGKR